jgi:RNA recognition motif-containing protein
MSIRDTLLRSAYGLMPLQPPPQPRVVDMRRVFVGNIGWWVDDALLAEFFGRFGTITDMQVGAWCCACACAWVISAGAARAVLCCLHCHGMCITRCWVSVMHRCHPGLLARQCTCVLTLPAALATPRASLGSPTSQSLTPVPVPAQVMWNTRQLQKGKKINREFAFISYATPEEAQRAINFMHGKCLEGLTKDSDGLTVQYEAIGSSKKKKNMG